MQAIYDQIGSPFTIHKYVEPVQRDGGRDAQLWGETNINKFAVLRRLLVRD